MTDRHLDILDRQLLEILQDTFPLAPRPWHAIGRRLGIPEGEVLRRVRRLADEGIVLTVSPVIESARIGPVASTLIGMRVPADRVERCASIVNREPGVSHNYLRDHDYNLWFTLAAPDSAALRRTVEDIAARAGVPPADLLDLPAVRRFKIGVRFRFFPDGDGEGGI
ncbi:MAG: HTH-type transcriptional regulator Ptr1 [Euryarchaeota archaeon ADurb.Bin009]|jgi:DNA-binding Lrp family transcriptional regulator|uniref:siroheme decarboxylase subunit alpha n=1 Tax=Methanoculleus sp. TaxID=90427 RepID=UPI0009D0C94B|nr:AsnC family transcriptional regulator [Methanoculleus sp.]OQC71025.1 MAG: HTH-type transcriptional regulator Ptr1 [Euryarchaeota archaeon ADurb.Bin009]HNT07734.1 AsnC family transcriptional regulator [Methanoculleus sp.]HOC83056.1 AsnC family transcriptional regulator [Methanoculleus sp.]HOF96765.1 AsnC family transcriptional regulator [Methanoculleus sp.]HOI62281.1 AsnC family transcriptional regulator [Methanoculleus sp.]